MHHALMVSIKMYKKIMHLHLLKIKKNSNIVTANKLYYASWHFPKLDSDYYFKISKQSVTQTERTRWCVVHFKPCNS